MEQFFSDILNSPALGKWATLGVWLFIIWLLVLLVKKVATSRITDTDIRYRTRKALNFFGYAFSIIIGILIFYRQLGGVTVALGVAGAGIAFALQEVIASFAGWMAVAFGGFYKVGDRVELGGIKGDVIDIGMLRTTLMETGEWVKGYQYNGCILRIANSFVFKAPVFNYSGDFPFLWDEIQVPIQYGSDYKLVKQVLLESAQIVVGDYSRTARETWASMVKKYRLENATTEPTASLVANDNWVEFTLRYPVDYKKRRVTKDALFTRMLEQADIHKDKFRFASATFHIVEAPELKVKINP